VKKQHKKLHDFVEITDSIKDAIGQLVEVITDHFEQGIDCPCCGRYVKLYKRKLHNEMATFLMQLVRQYKSEPRWYSTRELVTSARKASTDGSYLVHWGLIERKSSKNSSGATCGMYRPTKLGIKFSQNKVSVPSHLHMICGEVAGFGPDHIYIKDCLESPFEFAQLMGGIMESQK